jgi:hypothetical protein
MVEGKRARALNVRMLDAEVEMLTELAELEGVSVSEWIRNIVRVQHAITVGRSAKPVKKTSTAAKPKSKIASSAVHTDAPSLQKAGSRMIVFVPEPGNSLGRMLDPQRDADEIRKAVAAYAKRNKLGAEWVRSKKVELGV